MTSDFDMILKRVHADANKNPDVIEIEDENSNSILIHDYSDEVFDKRYRITDTAVMDKEWLLNHVIITPSLSKASEQGNTLWSSPMPIQRVLDFISDFILNYVPKETYKTLNKLVLIYDDEEDFDWLYQTPIKDYAEDFDYLLEIHEFPPENGIGLTWSSDCVTIVNLKHIKEASDDLLSSGDISEAEQDEDVIRGVLMTIAHEFRHLQQNCPYQKENIDFLQDPEIDAETFAVFCYEQQSRSRGIY